MSAKKKPASPKREVGPNSGRIEYMPNGDKVEWIEDTDDKGKPIEFPMLLLRGDKAICKACKEFHERVWWNRHQSWLYAIETGKEPLTKEQKPILERAKKAAARIQRKFGRKNLVMNDFEFGLLSGKLSALNWVQGMDWEESLDT